MIDSLQNNITWLEEPMLLLAMAKNIAPTEASVSNQCARPPKAGAPFDLGETRRRRSIYLRRPVENLQNEITGSPFGVLCFRPARTIGDGNKNPTALTRAIVRVIPR